MKSPPVDIGTPNLPIITGGESLKSIPIALCIRVWMLAARSGETWSSKINEIDDMWLRRD